MSLPIPALAPRPAPPPQGPPPFPPVRCDRDERERRVLEAVELAEVTLAWRQRLLGRLS